MIHVRSTLRTLPTLGLALFAVLNSAAGPAASRSPERQRFHVTLKHAEPGVNDTIATSPTVIKLWFSESVPAASTSIRVTGATDREFAIGPVTVDAPAMSPAVVALSETLPPGTYDVAWHAMASDGHPSSGKYSFTIRSRDAR